MCSMQPTLNLPNPHDWMTVRQAEVALDVHRSTLYDMVSDGRLGDYHIGSMRVFWRAEVANLAAALKLARPRRA